MFLQGAVSLRGCRAIVRVLQKYLPPFRGAPAASTVQSWLLRIGLHELLRAKAYADDWIWIVDHTIQLGAVKCLLIVGVRQAVWETLDRPLVHQDLSVITLEPVEKSNGDIVHEQLKRASEKVGAPRVILRDQGSDIRCGTSQFLKDHQTTLVCHDIAHRTALVLKAELTADSRWASFVKQCGQSQPRVKQTELGHLAPPTQKIKGRYMNLGPLIGWGAKMLALVETPSANRPAEGNLTRLDEKFDWICGYRAALDNWADLDAIKDCLLTYVRIHGYDLNAATELAQALKSVARTPAGRRMAKSLVEFVRTQSQGLGRHECVPGSSEVLESLIGKGKRMHGQHSRGGFTRMLLAMAASVVNLTQEGICTALETIRETDLPQWCNNQLGPTLTAQRRKILNGTKPE